MASASDHPIMDDQPDADHEAPVEPRSRRPGTERIVIHDDFADPLPAFEHWADSPIVPSDEPEPSA